MRLRNGDDVINESNVAYDLANREDSFVDIVSRVRSASSNPMAQFIADKTDSENDESEVLCAAHVANSSAAYETVLSSERKHFEVNLCNFVE